MEEAYCPLCGCPLELKDTIWHETALGLFMGHPKPNPRRDVSGTTLQEVMGTCTFVDCMAVWNFREFTNGRFQFNQVGCNLPHDVQLQRIQDSSKRR
jgi:hypothetical protein